MAIKIETEVDNGGAASGTGGAPAVNTPPQSNTTKIITAVVLAIVAFGIFMLTK
jgi:hypothetical protein